MEREEIPFVWQIDRREIIQNIYQLRAGELVLGPDYFDVKGWPPGQAEHYTPIMTDCFDRGGTFWGAFENEKIIGTKHNTLQLKFLHVSRDQRKQGLAGKLFQLAVEKAKSLGAKKMYISATPSENTIDFYMHLGCALATEIDPELFALEPEDIHLEYLV